MPSFEPARDERSPRFFVPDAHVRVRGSSRRAEPPPAAPVPAPAEPSLDEVRAAAYAEGLAAGRAELPWREAETLASAAEALAEATHVLAATRRRYLVAQRGALVELAIAMAERLVAREIRADRDALAAAVERALALREESEPAIVRLHPGDAAAVSAGLAPALARIVESGGARVEPDASLAPGDARVELGGDPAGGGARREIDARTATALARLRDELAELLELEEGAS